MFQLAGSLFFSADVVVVVLNIASKFKTDVNKLPNTHRGPVTFSIVLEF